jgi:asparagine synthase (glutamine-hydrolysing)
MCGIAGFWGDGDTMSLESSAIAERMAGAIKHRGPDDSGIWHEQDAQITLVHRRLSILDLTDSGRQPMKSKTGRYVIVFNGEIYNHNELRTSLALASQQDDRALKWRGHSDTETLLAGIEHWGLKETLQRAVGMFALAVWDRNTQTLQLARDRIGEKPLYYGIQNGVFVWGSELKAIRQHPLFNAEIDPASVLLYFRHNYIPAPYSIYRDISKLLPGQILRVKRMQEGFAWDASNYWSFPEVALQGLGNPFQGADVDAVNSLHSKLRRAVSDQMVADVPVGAFLSGGVDSSTIVALMQENSARSINTFTIGFEEAEFDEAVHARQIAKMLGTAHSELYVTPRAALEAIPRMPIIYDEPFSDSSQIPTFLVAEMTRHSVTVALSGDGGDELFGGYNRYLLADRLWKKIDRIPLPVRTCIGNSIRRVSPDSWTKLLDPFSRALPNAWRVQGVGDKLHKAASLLDRTSMEELYLGLVTHWTNGDRILADAEMHVGSIFEGLAGIRNAGQIERMMAADTMTYLPDDILVKVDRAAMSVSLETRVPMLDHRIVEFAWELPLRLKLRQGRGKWILREILSKYIPRNIHDQPKKGFAIPLDRWLRGPLRDWAENLLDEKKIASDGILNPEPIRDKWLEHLTGRRNWQYHLWDVLMFQAWLEREKSTVA